jgi:predicted nucleotidyltransferase
MQKEQVLQIIRDHKQELAEKYHVKKVGIFGSVARNSAGPDSDIDIVVEMEPNLLLQAELQADLESLLMRKVDVIRYWKRMNQYLKAHIDEEALYV